MIYKVLSLINQPIPAGRSNFDVMCPSCGKKKLNINVLKGVCNCPKCNEGGGPVALYGFVKYGILPSVIKNSDVYNQLRREINGFSSEIPEDQLQKPKVIERVDVDPIDIKNRSECYSNLLNHLFLESCHKENLLARGLPEKVIEARGYKSVPSIGLNKIASVLLKEGNNLLGTPGFFEKDGKWTLQRNDSGFFVPVRDIEGNIQGMQIRFDNPFDGQKYRWLTSSGKEKGAGAKTWSHFVGYPEETVYLTEGPLKADIINYYMDVPVIAIPGVSAIQNLVPMLDKLKSMGVRTICTCFDMDFLTNPHVEKAYQNLCLLLTEKGFAIKKKKWNENYKGLDDYLLAQSKGELKNEG